MTVRNLSFLLLTFSLVILIVDGIFSSGISSSTFQFFGVLIFIGSVIGLSFIFTKKTLVRYLLSVLGIIFSFFIILPFGLICFDSCPENSRIFITLAAISAFSYAAMAAKVINILEFSG